MASIDIDWASLGKVAAASAVFGIGIVAVFTAGVLGMSKAEAAGETPGGSSQRTAGLAIAGVAFAICAAAVLYGLYLLIPQFH